MIEEYAELMGTGHESKEIVKPEDEFFHSVYIAGTSRKNHIDIVESAGKLQVRGVEYNKDKVHMIVTHVKRVLVKIKTDEKTKKDKTECFSFQQGTPPWHGFNNRVCGQNATERASNDFCKDCKGQIILAGIYTDEHGNPILSEEKKPTFVFIRGKGMKYSGVSTYLDELSKMELDPIFTPVTEETKRFEKNVVNNKRFVTGISIGTQDSKYGIKQVFKLETGVKLPTEKVHSILKLAKKTIEKFNEKFDESSRGNNNAASSYIEETHHVDNSNKFNDTSNHEAPITNSQATTQSKVEEPSVSFNFEDVEF